MFISTKVQTNSRVIFKIPENLLYCSLMLLPKIREKLADNINSMRNI